MSSEDRNSRFKRLAENRVNKTIKLIRLVGNLSNRSNYSYTDEQVEKIFGVLQAELKAARRRFDEASKDSAETFQL